MPKIRRNGKIIHLPYPKGKGKKKQKVAKGPKRIKKIRKKRY